uniref:Ubiquitin-like domain-containing protein n=1 Tax=Arion vulgaris TaxID=1028688 RepID=A0A0B7AM50_9EUPU
MNQVNYTWKEVLAICSMFPVLEELHCSFNNIVHLADAFNVLSGLRILDLMTNNIQDWLEMLKLGNLPRLETLIISENKIKSIFFPDCSPTEKTSYFCKLKTLIIKRNEISGWSSVNELNKLQNLEELQVAENPILRTFNIETVRQLFVAKVGSLKLFSRTPITYEERKGAEIDYLKRFGTEWKLEGGNGDSAKNRPSDKFIANHPRYQAISEKWGAPEDSELVEKSTALKENLLAINIFSPQYPDKGTLSKKLPGTMSIQKLKTLIQRIYRESSEPKLKYTSHKIATAPEIELDNGMRQLGFFSIEPGDTILVSW